MTSLRLLISSEFKYELATSQDAGPSYSSLLGIECFPISEIDTHLLSPRSVFVVDNRISDHEFRNIVQVCIKAPECKFFFRVVDPYFEHARYTNRFHSLCELHRHPNIGILSAYHPVETTAILFQLFGKQRFLVSPYPYDSSKEIDSKSKRINKIIISGAQSPSIYPMRAIFRHKRNRSLLWRLFTADLKHPGYLDIGQSLKHGKLGSKYIEYLSKFQFMLCCPSYLGLEFLKFTECAYAGCCPVGTAADTLPAAAVNAMFVIDNAGWNDALTEIRRAPQEEILQRAHAYRDAMKEARAPKKLRTAIADFVSSWGL